MGAGKSSVAEYISNIYKLRFYDTDVNIEKKQNKSISDIFLEYGETYFRELEKIEILYLSKQNDLIISLGGGAFCNLENIEIIKNSGISIYLKSSANEILNRLTNEEVNKRPLLKDKKSFINLMEKREIFYSKSNITIITQNKTVEEISLEILEKLK